MICRCLETMVNGSDWWADALKHRPPVRLAAQADGRCGLILSIGRKLTRLPNFSIHFHTS